MDDLKPLYRIFKNVFDGLFDILDKIDNAFPWFFYMIVGLFILYHIVDKLLLPVLGGNTIDLGGREVSSHSSRLNVSEARDSAARKNKEV